ncbi:hypothetical protein V495_04673 [Pseudogymnoascus sp. VKM F-4514 (FW-929)]|nr:hypothetical protein V495_04673 [Pseudogymnoascus sp. VKM F-4514 (FW-929)]KFY64933.1 hypothetical protein V497_01544 [Pseudogymnoascus sp. VKM F-4516 (FW-969)]
MVLEKLNNLELPASADMHVHLRDGATKNLVVPSIRDGGVNCVMVMPNLVPPITTVSHALEYQKSLQALAPKVTFLMSLYLHPSVTPATIAEAAAAGIKNVKSYPAGVTTNSSAGVVDYSVFYPVFAAMEEHNMILNLHGELPSTADSSITVLSAEEKFLPTLLALHKAFPRLRIILEHCTTAAAIETVKSCGPTVAATITAHHLYLIVDDVVGNPHHFCKPVAKLPADRKALLSAAVAGGEKFFFGSDSAPHAVSAKEMRMKPAAGCFTQGEATQLVLEAVVGAVGKGLLKEEEVTVEGLEGFLGNYGRKFYGVEANGEKIVLKRGGAKVADMLRGEGDLEIMPFRAGEETWSLEWKA